MTTSELLVAGGVAASILLIAWALAGGIGGTRVRERLTQLGTPEARNLEELELQAPLTDRTLRPIASRIAGLASRATSASFATRTKERLALAGDPAGLSVGAWLTLKLIIALVAAGIFGILFLILGASAITAVGMSVLSLGVGYIAPEFWLSDQIRVRQAGILRMIPDALDLLTISVRAGLGFDGALTKVVEQLDGPLSDEFRRALAEIRLGKPRRDALRDIVPRTNVRALSNFIGAILQAGQLGVPIGKVLQIQSEQLRIVRRQHAEQMAAKAPIKMLLPLVGCIFPSIFIVLLGPALILILTTLGQ
jgi:tight adherence protein C